MDGAVALPPWKASMIGDCYGLSRGLCDDGAEGA